MDEGLISTEQLEQALEAQNETEKQLGEVLVMLGFISPGVVANGLAEQHGGPLKTEYGISAGFGGGRGEPSTGEPVAPPPPVPADVLAAWRSAVEQRDAVIERFRDELQEQGNRVAALTSQLSAAAARIAELEERRSGERDELQARLVDLLSERDRQTDAIAALEATVTAARTYATERHHLFVPSPDGYRLVERDGAAPRAGERVELEGFACALLVARIGPSPLGGAGLACAYLAAP